MLFLLVGMTSFFAQKQVNVSGRITDELNEPMIGVSVLEKGTTNGVITDLDKKGDKYEFMETPGGHVWTCLLYTSYL